MHPEILNRSLFGPAFFDTVVWVSAVLTALVVVVMAIIVSMRWATDRQLRRRARFRKAAEPVIARYLEGAAKPESAISALRAEPKESLALLLDISDSLQPAERAKLNPLFAAFPFAKDQTLALKNRRWETRFAAAGNLGYFADPAAAPVLLAALKDDVLAVRFEAARSLVALGRADAIEPILLALDVPGEMAQRRVAEILAVLGQGAVDPLIAVLESTDPQYSDAVLTVAARVLGMLRASQAVPALIGKLGGDDYSLRLNCVRSLGLIGDKSAVGPIAGLANDRAWEVRNSVMQALGRLGATGQISLLTKALADPAWWVRYSAAKSLYWLGNDGIGVLRSAMAEHLDRYARDISRQILEEHKILGQPEARP